MPEQRCAPEVTGFAAEVERVRRKAAIEQIEADPQISWEAHIGLYYGTGADGSRWVVSLPSMTAERWSVEGPEYSGSGARSLRDAKIAAEVEYRARAQRQAESPQARLRALVASLREPYPHGGDMSDPETVGYANGVEAGREAAAEALSELITEVYGEEPR